jgi:hypothetical protein
MAACNIVGMPPEFFHCSGETFTFRSRSDTHAELQARRGVAGTCMKIFALQLLEAETFVKIKIRMSEGVASFARSESA